MGRGAEEGKLNRAQAQQVAHVAMAALERPIEAGLDEVVDLAEPAQQGRQQPPSQGPVARGQGGEAFRFGERLVERPAPVQDLRQELEGDRARVADKLGHARALARRDERDTPPAASRGRRIGPH